VYKIRKKIAESLCFNRSYDLLLKKNIQRFRIKKNASFPHLQVMHRFYYKILFFLQKNLNSFNKNFKINKIVTLFKMNFLKNIIFLNYFIKNLNFFSNNYYVKRLFSLFENSSNIFYNFFFIKCMPRKEFDFDQYNFISGTNEG